MGDTCGSYFAKDKRVCPYCDKTYRPEHRKQITCGSYECKLSRMRHLRIIKQEQAADRVVCNHKMTKTALRVKKAMDVARIGHPWAEEVERYSEDFR